MTPEDQTQEDQLPEALTPEEQAEENTFAGSDENAEQNVQTIILEPWNYEKLYEHALFSLQNSAQDKEEVAAYYRYLQIKHFGQEVSEEEAKNAGLEDERQQALVAEYLHDKLDGIKSASLSLKQPKVNSAFESIFALVGMELNTSTTSEEHYDKVFSLRAGQIDDLMEDYKIMQLNRNIAEIYANKGQMVEVEEQISAIEDWHDDGALDDDQLAKFYYNIGMLYEGKTSQRNTEKRVNNESKNELYYKCMALDFVQTDMALILDIYRDWRNSYDFEPREVERACKRVIDNSSSSRNIYRAHKLIADINAQYGGTDGFGDKREKRINKVIYHYRRALEYVERPEKKVHLLNIISAQQEHFDKKGYIETRMEIANLLKGRARIRELERIADNTDNNDLKVSVLEAGINEFSVLPGLDNEDRHLYNDFDRKLRSVLPNDKNKNRTIAVLDKKKTEFGMPDTQKTKVTLSIMSSGGKDFFSGDGR